MYIVNVLLDFLKCTQSRFSYCICACTEMLYVPQDCYGENHNSLLHNKDEKTVISMS